MKEKMKLLVAALALLSLAIAPATSADTRTLHGQFTWTQGAQGDLEAVFTPTGEGTWDVAFHFTFDGTPHTYAGTARGSLAGGVLAGEVENESGERRFRFDGTFKDARFEGKHAELHDGKARETGTLSLAG